MSKRTARIAPPAPVEAPRPWWHWLDVAPAAWLVVVISAYGVLTAYPIMPSRAPVGGVAAADPLALPFLVLTVTAGIIRYFYARDSDQNGAVDPAIAPTTRRDTS